MLLLKYYIRIRIESKKEIYLENPEFGLWAGLKVGRRIGNIDGQLAQGGVFMTVYTCIEGIS